MQDCAVAAEGGCEVDFRWEGGLERGGGWGGGVDWEGKGGVESDCVGGLEDDGYVGIGCVNVPGDIRSRGSWGLVWNVYFANSRTASVAFGAFSFLTRRIFRGGEGHCKDNRSFPFVSVDISGCSFRMASA